MKRFDSELAAGRLDEILGGVRILYTDLDGTLLGRRGCLLVDGENRPCADAARTIVDANLCEQLTIVPTTGRSVTQLIEISRLCGWDDFLAEVGAVRSYWHADEGRRENIYDTPLWGDDVLAGQGTPLDVITESGAVKRLQEAFPGQLEYHSPWNVNRQATNVLRGRVDMARAAEILARIEPPITMIENGVIHPSSHTLVESDEPIRAYHLAPTGVTKGTAIRADLARRGLKREEALMIGDGLADLECAHDVAAVMMVRNSLLNDGMAERMEQTDGAYLMSGAQGDGWVELVRAILARIGE